MKPLMAFRNGDNLILVKKGWVIGARVLGANLTLRKFARLTLAPSKVVPVSVALPEIHVGDTCT